MMNTFNISINTIDKVKRFVNLTNRCEADVDIISGRLLVDAKSIMGIFSMDLTRPMTLIVHESNIEKLEEYKKLFEEFIIE
ncbi:MAG: HPr family phosphocarrier protein [Bacteroidaceae bacterium]|nr:HPr family phosphocarrier protein [Bacteroidaceae bacterium]